MPGALKGSRAARPASAPAPSPVAPSARAPAPATAAGLRGASQEGLRRHNVLAVLQAVREQGALSAAGIAHATGLTAQTVSTITKDLVEEGLLRRGAPVRGRVGQPSVPLSIDPDGAYALGISVGRGRQELIAIDLAGAVRERARLDAGLPDPPTLLPWIAAGTDAVRRRLGPRAARLQGCGLAVPLSMHAWAPLLGMSPSVARHWRRQDLAAQVQDATGLACRTLKDTSAACLAELHLGRGRNERDFVYVYVDTFVGGAIVVDGRLHVGPRGNAGALGSMPVGPTGQLLDIASLLPLERALADAGVAPGVLRAAALPDGAVARRLVERWVDQAALALAPAIQAAVCVVDAGLVVIDGAIGGALLALLCEKVHAALLALDSEGVEPPRVAAGTLGADATVLGAALLPIVAQWMPGGGGFVGPAPVTDPPRR